MAQNLDIIMSVLLLLLFSVSVKHQEEQLRFLLSFRLLLLPRLNCATPPSKVTSQKRGCSYTGHHYKRLQTRWNAYDWTTGASFLACGKTTLATDSCLGARVQNSSSQHLVETWHRFNFSLSVCRCISQSRRPVIKHQCEHSRQQNSVSHTVSRQRST